MKSISRFVAGAGIGLMALLPAVIVLGQAAPANTQAAGDELTGKLVTIKADKVALKEVFSQMQAQTGLKISIPGPIIIGPEYRPVTENVTNKPMWDVLRDLLGQVDQHQPVNFTMGDPSMGQSLVAGYVSTSGPFLVLANRITRMADYTQADADVQSLQLQLQLYCDPSAHITGLSQLSSPLRATDDAGNSLVPAHPPAEMRANYGSVQGIYGFQTSLQLVSIAPEKAGHKLTVLEGEIPVTVGLTRTVEVTPGKTFKEKIDTVNVTIDVTSDISHINGVPPRIANMPGVQMYVVVQVTRDDNGAQPAAGRGRGPVGRGGINDPVNMMSRPTARLVDEANVPWRQMTSSSISSSVDSRTMVIGFTSNLSPKPGEAKKAIVDLQIGSKDVVVPYHFEGIPLP